MILATICFLFDPFLKMGYGWSPAFCFLLCYLVCMSALEPAILELGALSAGSGSRWRNYLGMGRRIDLGGICLGQFLDQKATVGMTVDEGHSRSELKDLSKEGEEKEGGAPGLIMTHISWRH